MQERRPLLWGGTGPSPSKRLRVGGVLLAVGALALVAVTASYSASQRAALEEPSSQPGVEQWRPMAPPRFDETYGAGYPGYATSYGAGGPGYATAYGNLPAEAAAAYAQPSYAQMDAYNNPLAGTAVTYMPPGGAPSAYSNPGTAVSYMPPGEVSQEAMAMGMYQPYPYGPLPRPVAPGPTGPGGAWSDYGPQTQTQIVINGDGAADEGEADEGEEGDEEYSEKHGGDGKGGSHTVTISVPQGPLPVNFPAVQLAPGGAPFGSTSSTAKFFNDYAAAKRLEDIEATTMTYALPKVNITYTNADMVTNPEPYPEPWTPNPEP